MKQLREYITDITMVKILFYLLFIKAPLSVVMNGMSLILFAGICTLVSSPLIFWIAPDYFNDDKFCLFGQKTENSNGTTCHGWAINSFGGTIAVFLLFVPLLPLTLHLSKYTAERMFNVTAYFLTLEFGYHSRSKIKQ